MATSAVMDRPTGQEAEYKPTSVIRLPDGSGKELVEALPNAYQTLYALRNNDADNYSALLDISDNSVDASATKIDFQVYRKGGEIHIQISDNGIGMDRDNLVEALRLGTIADRDINADFGKFGVGLILSSLSIAKRLDIYTRQEGGSTWHGALDLDVIKRKNAFVVEVEEETDENVKVLDADFGVGRAGTYIILTKCDQISNKQTTSFANTLIQRVGQTYRDYITGYGGQRRLQITVNGNPVPAIDPMMREESDTRVYIDKEYPVSFTNGEGESIASKIKLLMVEIPKSEGGTSGERKKDMMLLRRQGFYVMRNHREIAAGEALDLYLKHQVFNRVRIELQFPGELDEALGVNNQKQLAPKRGIAQEVKDTFLKDVLNNLTTIRRNTYREKSAATTPQQQEVVEQAEKDMNEKRKFLLGPEGRRETRQRQPKPSERDRKDQGPSTGRERGVRTGVIDPSKKPKYEILLNELGPSSPIYDCYQEGDKVFIRVNTEHSFYRAFVMNYLDDEGRLPVHVQFIYASMALAELRLDQDDQLKLRSEFLPVMSSNLTVLLS